MFRPSEGPLPLQCLLIRQVHESSDIQAVFLKPWDKSFSVFLEISSFHIADGVAIKQQRYLTPRKRR